MASKGTRKQIRKYSSANIDAKHIARVGAMAFTIGIGGMIVTSPGVAWADDVTGSTDSTSTESNSQPASTAAGNQDTTTESSTTPVSPTEPSKSGSASTRKRPVSTFLSETLSETVAALRGNLVARSPRAAVTSKRDADPVDTPAIPEETPPAEAEKFSLEKFVDGLPVSPVLESFLPQALTNPGIAGQPAQSLGGTEQIQQFHSADMSAAHVDVLHVDPAHEDPGHVDPAPVHNVLPGIEDLTNAFADLGEFLSGFEDLANGGALPPLPQLPFPGADSPEPVVKAWACLCSLVAEARPVTDQLSGLFNEIFAPIIAGPDPGGAPTNSPLDWAVFAWVRRQADEALSSDIMQAVQAYALQGWQQFLVSCAGPTEGLPAELERTVLVDGLNEPLDFAFLPDDPENPDDGGILIAEKSGAIKLYKEGEPTTTVVTLPVKTDFESGIGGIEVDPDYAENHYVYVAYTNASNEDMLSRFTLEGTQAQILASEVVLIRTNDAAGPSHHGGEVYYEDNPDGETDYIYWAKGDNNIGANAQDLSNLHGKIVRIEADGTIPEDNPFYNTPGARQEIWAYGLRNPFRFTTTPDGQLLVGDVGGADWEELNLVEKGANYGWPNAEGTCIGCGYENPVYTYAHATQPAGTGSITSVLVYTDDALGEEYQGKVFIADYTAGWIKVLDLGPNYSTFVSEQTLDGQAGTPVKLLQGPDGNIYQLNIYPGELSVIGPAGGNRAPTADITATPSNGYQPLTVNFSSAGSTDPEGAPLTYNWDFGDGTTSTEANPTHTYTTDGVKVVTLTVSDGEKTDQATQNVTVGSTPPTIGTMEVDKPTYDLGDTITFTADGARDPDPRPDGQELPASAYKWTVLFRHEDHVHPVTTIEGQKSGSFTVPSEPHAAPGEETSYEITLTVTDSTGLSTSRTIVVTPNPVSQTVQANDPDAMTSVAGVGRGLGTTSPPSNL